MTMWQRFSPNPVLRMPETLAIAGRRYVLSDHFAMMEGMGEAAQPQQPGKGARLIMGPPKMRYLWALDTDTKTIGMWRVSDGDEKAWGAVNLYMSDVVALERRKQLNRVNTRQFQEIDLFFRERYDKAFEELKAHAKELSSPWEKRAKVILERYFNKYVFPTIKRRWEEIQRGVHPFGFRVNRDVLKYRSAEDQARIFVADQVMANEFTQEKAYEIVQRSTGIDPYDPPDGDPQDVQWAYHEVREEFLEQHFP